jgi:hypothetical protein
LVVKKGASGATLAVARDASGWSTIATLALPAPNFDVATSDPISIADVTGDGHPDFLVPVDAADNVPGVVVSADSGQWRLVPDGTGNVYYARDARFVNGHLVTGENDCQPNCAQGTTTQVTWTYRRAPGTFAKQ